MQDLYVVGDSISLDPYAHDAVGWVPQLKALAPRRLVESFAIGAQTLGTMSSIAQALARTSPRMLMSALGSNDINTGQVAAVMIVLQSIMKGYADSAGALFYLWTVPPCSSWGGAQNAERATYNAWARAHGDRCVDADALLRDPASPNSLAPRFLIASEPLDTIHPNTAAGRVLALDALERMAL